VLDGIRLVIELEKFPVPVPSLVFVVKLIVGAVAVFHTIPLVVTASPPSLLTFPPLDALFNVILEIFVVVIVGVVLEGVFSLVAQLCTVDIAINSTDNLKYTFFILVGF
jgi:hypothetical protein